MRIRGLGARLAGLLLCAGAHAAAQETPGPSSRTDPAAAISAQAGSDGPRAARVPRMTEVAIEILDPLGSKISKSLDTFRIALAEPLTRDGVAVIPAGTPGLGEVVHAKKAGGMGAAGELVIAARFLDFGGRQVRLRSTVVEAQGKSRINGVSTLAVASAASPLPIGVVGFFIKGGEIELPAGTRAIARLAEDFTPAPGGAAEGDSVAAGAAPDVTGGTTE